MKFDYFYHREGEKFSFYILPKVLIYDDLFRELSSDAKILYACLLDRMDLSNKNGWRDSDGRVFIIFTIEEIMKSLNKSNKTAVKIMKELDDIGLIERKRQGLGKPNLIYVMDFMTPFLSECKSYTSEVKNLHSRNVKATSQEMKKVQRTNTNNNNTDITNTDLNKGKAVYGYFQNVYLSDEELMNLQTLLGYRLDNYIERLSSYLKSTGGNYDDHHATILSWFHKDQGNRNNANTGSNIPTLEDYNEGDFL
jgi:predicted transcriptional regulator